MIESKNLWGHLRYLWLGNNSARFTSSSLLIWDALKGFILELALSSFLYWKFFLTYGEKMQTSLQRDEHFKETYLRVQVDVVKVYWTFSKLFSIFQIVDNPPNKSQSDEKKLELVKNENWKTCLAKHLIDEFLSFFAVFNHWLSFQLDQKMGSWFNYVIFSIYEPCFIRNERC